MSLMLWLEEEEEQPKESKNKEKAQEAPKCPCGRKVCCGKHKNGECACHQRGHERG